MSETPQEMLAAYLASPSSGALWEIGVREAIRAVLAEDTSLKLANEQYVEQRNQALREQEATFLRMEKAEAERDALRESETEYRRLTDAAHDDLRAEVDALRADGTIASLAVAIARAEKAEAALRKLTVDAALQGRVFKGNEELPGAEEFYRAYNAGIKTQFKYARDIAHAALCDTATRCVRGQGMGDVDVCETHQTIWPCVSEPHREKET